MKPVEARKLNDSIEEEKREIIIRLTDNKRPRTTKAGSYDFKEI